ncbi:unnamed protein product [Amoebophrya sp. A25]|nr:unnamed protein product [Amoebophrya sp. A25]|eukprot:GSA25T00026334001.1
MYLLQSTSPWDQYIWKERPITLRRKISFHTPMLLLYRNPSTKMAFVFNRLLGCADLKLHEMSLRHLLNLLACSKTYDYDRRLITLIPCTNEWEG